MQDLRIPVNSTVLYGDNQSAIAVCKYPQSSDRTRHIEGKYKKIQEFVKNDILRVEWVSNQDMLADGLTKQLARPAFEKFRNDIGVLMIPE